MIPEQILTAILLVPLLGTFAVALSPAAAARTIAIALSWLMVVLSVMLGMHFDASKVGMQFVYKMPWFDVPFPVDFHVGIDGMSLCLVILTAFVTLMSVYASEKVGETRPQFYYSMLMLLVASIVGVFISLNLVQFFVFYELELVPMYFLIAIWGGPNRNYAAMKFLLYTFFGGIFMFFGMLFLYNQLGSMQPVEYTLNMVRLAEIAPMLPFGAQVIACLGFLIAFIIKLPSFPLHTWLPDAHVEAPTPISMILAGLLLKMGSYGLVRICLGFFPDAIIALSSILMAIGAFNIVWAAIACMVQDDMKRVIAYSSVSHMGFVLLGIGSLSAAAISGAIFQMISHGVISALLFFMVGTIYERCHTRNIGEIGGGLAHEMPKLFYFWMFATMANLGLPALSGFVAEALVFYGSYTSPVAMSVMQGGFAKGCIIVAATGVILTAGYMLWLLKRLFYGPIAEKWQGHLSDARRSEVFVASCLAASILILGIYPLWMTGKYEPVADGLAKVVSEHLQPINIGSVPGVITQ